MHPCKVHVDKILFAVVTIFDGPFLQRLSLSSAFDLLGGTGIVEMGEFVTEHGGDLLASLRVGDFVPEPPFAANECPHDGCLVDFPHDTGNDEALVPSGRCFFVIAQLHVDEDLETTVSHSFVNSASSEKDRIGMGQEGDRKWRFPFSFRGYRL